MEQLKKHLTFNAIFSLFSGFIMIFYSASLQSIFGFENSYVFPIIGGNLLFFAAVVYLVSVRYLDHKLFVNIISTLDGLWVIGSIIISGFQLFELSSNGYLIISTVAMWIGYLGYQQYLYNRA
jgi:hypothetical protein